MALRSLVQAMCQCLKSVAVEDVPEDRIGEVGSDEWHDAVAAPLVGVRDEEWKESVSGRATSPWLSFLLETKSSLRLCDRRSKD